jgi:hypothetical protein
MSIWDKYPNYSSDELRMLTAVVAETLVDSAEDPAITADVLKVSPKSAATQLRPLLQEKAPDIQTAQIQAALEDPERAQKMAVAVLGKIRDAPLLAERVAEAYEARNREMCGPEMLLLAGAVVILAIKLKDIKISSEGLSVSFDKSAEEVKAFVAGLVRSITGA